MSMFTFLFHIPHNANLADKVSTGLVQARHHTMARHMDTGELLQKNEANAQDSKAQPSVNLKSEKDLSQQHNTSPLMQNV